MIFEKSILALVNLTLSEDNLSLSESNLKLSEDYLILSEDNRFFWSRNPISTRLISI